MTLRAEKLQHRAHGDGRAARLEERLGSQDQNFHAGPITTSVPPGYRCTASRSARPVLRHRSSGNDAVSSLRGQGARVECRPRKVHQPRRLAQEAGAPGGVAVTDSVQMITPQPLGSNARRGGPAAARRSPHRSASGGPRGIFPPLPTTPTQGRGLHGHRRRHFPVHRGRFSGFRHPPFGGGARGPRYGAHLGGRAPHPDHRRGLRRGEVSQAADPRDGRAGALRRQPARGVRLRRPQQRGLRPHHAGAGAGRLGDPVVRLGAGRAGDVSDLCLRLGGAEEEVAPAARLGTGDRLLRAHRARLRLQPRRA